MKFYNQGLALLHEWQVFDLGSMGSFTSNTPSPLEDNAIIPWKSLSAEFINVQDFQLIYPRDPY